MWGYTGKILRVDLSTGEMNTDTLPEKTLRDYIGGSGVGTRILMDEAGADVDPFGPDNLLIFMTGPLTGTAVPTSGRHEVVAKSPLTGGFGEGDAGGTWGTALKKAGFDGIVIKGISPKPAYLLIDDGSFSLQDASLIWGQDTYETEKYFKAKYGSYLETSCIGVAGENLVKLASILHNGKDARAVGRGGLGAVMGSKRLKAIVAGGRQDIPVFAPLEIKKSIVALAPTIVKNTKAMKDFGTAGTVIGCEKIGDLPIRNWRDGSWTGAKEISGQKMTSTILSGRYFCKSCIIGCGREVKFDNGRYRADGAGPEYETLGMLGGSCMVEDLEAIAYANELCNRYGLDTISVGSVIAMAMELYENGLINEQDTGGIALDWGNAEAMLELIRQIAEGTGIGKLLGNGVRYVANEIGGKAAEYAIHVKGLEVPAHDPRAYNSMGLGYATSNRGACHLQGDSYITEKVVVIPEIGIMKPLDRFRTDNHGKIQADLQNIMCLMDSLKICKFIFFGGVNLTNILDWYKYVTGLDIELQEFLLIGERIFNLKRLYNNMCGITKKDDTLPERLLKQPRPDGGAAGNLPPLESMLEEYYSARGWDENGRPAQETLMRLGLE